MELTPEQEEGLKKHLELQNELVRQVQADIKKEEEEKLLKRKNRNVKSNHKNQTT